MNTQTDSRETPGPTRLGHFPARAWWSGGLAVIRSVMAGLLVLLLARIVDAGEVSATHVVLAALIAVTMGVAAGAQPPLGARATARVSARLRRSLLRTWFSSGLAARDDVRAGEFVETATDGVAAVGTGVGHFFALVVRAAIAPACLAAMAMTIDPWVGLAILAGVPVLPFVVRRLERSFRQTGGSLREASEKLADRFLDSFQGMKTLASFDRIDDRGIELAEGSEDLRLKTMRLLARNLSALIWVDLSYSAVSVMTVVGVLALRSPEAGFSAGEVTALLALAILAVAPFVELIGYFYEGAIALASHRKIEAQRSRLASQAAPTEAGPTIERPGSVGVDDVSFSYPGALRPALQSTSFKVNGGERLAVVGRSGAGKTTLADLLLNLRQPTQGRVLINDVDLSQVSHSWIRRNVTYVGQNTYLFAATVAENLRMAAPTATDAELIAACKAAEIHDVVAALPDGYDTRLAERGTSLSGGERQRLGIARAILRDSPIVLLDEATSSLDVHTEAKVKASIDALAKDRTLIIITHRYSTMAWCDSVLMLEEGRITHHGPLDLETAREKLLVEENPLVREEAI